MPGRDDERYADFSTVGLIYRKRLGLPLARVFPERKVAFFWIGEPGQAMLGLWEAGIVPYLNA